MPFRHNHYHYFDERQVGRLLDFFELKFGNLNCNMEAIMATLADVQSALDSISSEIDKIGSETKLMLDKIEQFEAIDPEQQAVIDAIANKAQSIADRVKTIDDMVPDAVQAVEDVPPPSDPSTSEPTV